MLSSCLQAGSFHEAIHRAAAVPPPLVQDGEPARHLLPASEPQQAPHPGHPKAPEEVRLAGTEPVRSLDFKGSFKEVNLQARHVGNLHIFSILAQTTQNA